MRKVDYALEVDPLTLYIDPDVEKQVHAVQAVLPSARLFFEDFVVWRMLHGHEGVDVLAASGEEVVPPADEPSLVLVINKLERVARPGLLDLQSRSAVSATLPCLEGCDHEGSPA